MHSSPFERDTFYTGAKAERFTHVVLSAIPTANQPQMLSLAIRRGACRCR
jgi:hypothetical protein